jgi:heat shock protein HslJ
VRRSGLGGGLTCLLCACATTPPQAIPAAPIAGKWTIVAVDGERTGGGLRFNFNLGPSYGSAQFGCNRGSGAYIVGNGWFVAGDPWIITVASCPDKEDWLRFERTGFRILAKPLAIEQRPGGLRLRNSVGSIDLAPTPPLTVADIAGSWNVVSINGVGTLGGERFGATFGRREFTARFGCNEFRGIYASDHDRLRLSLAENTEMACEEAGPDAPVVPVMELEAWAEAILRSRPEVVLKSEYGMEIVSPKGTISLVRVR